MKILRLDCYNTISLNMIAIASDYSLMTFFDKHNHTDICFNYVFEWYISKTPWRPIENPTWVRKDLP